MFNLTNGNTYNLPFTKTSNSVAELISGEFHDKIHQIWNDSMMEYLAAPDFRRQVWHAWLSSKICPELDASLIDYLRFTKSRDLIKDGYGSCPPGYLSSLKKLGTAAREADVYLGLHDLFSRGGQVAKMLQHTQKVDLDTVTNLTEIPNNEFSAQVLRRLIQKSVEPERFSGAIWVAYLLQESLGEAAVLTALYQSSSPMKALRRMLTQLEFPEAPFDFGERLVPVTSGNNIRIAAYAFKNCLTDPEELVDLVFGILSGRQYLYRWTGAEPGLVQLGKFAARGWIIEDARGQSNAFFSRDTRREILDALAGYSSICPAWPKHQALPSYIWFYS